MIMSSSFAPTQNAENGFIAGSNPKWSSLLGGLVFRSLPPVLDIIPNSKVKNNKKQKTDYQLRKEGSDISQILTRKPPLYQGIKTSEEAQRVYGGSGNYIIGQSLT
jgi:hypothetical protein